MQIISEAALSPAAQLSAACSGCHIAGGTIPHIHTLSRAELATMLTRYRDEVGGTSVMHRLARGYSDEQIALIADYYTGAPEQN